MTDPKPLAGLTAHGRVQFFSAAPVPDGDRNGHYLLAESDRYRVYSHVGDHDGYGRIVYVYLDNALVFGEDGKRKTEETLWLTPLIQKSPGQMTDAIGYWFRDVLQMPPEVAAKWVPWMIEALDKAPA